MEGEKKKGGGEGQQKHFYLLSLWRLLVQEAPTESFVETRTDLPIRKDAIQGKIPEGEGMPWALRPPHSRGGGDKSTWVQCSDGATIEHPTAADDEAFNKVMVIICTTGRLQRCSAVTCSKNQTLKSFLKKQDTPHWPLQSFFPSTPPRDWPVLCFVHNRPGWFLYGLHIGYQYQ